MARPAIPVVLSTEEREHLEAVVLKPKGSGYLWAGNPTGEIAERHIAALGWPRVARNNSGLACWGNRTIIRDNDYIWCIGDPAKPCVPPEAVKPWALSCIAGMSAMPLAEPTTQGAR